jgi:hypothetical protein
MQKLWLANIVKQLNYKYAHTTKSKLVTTNIADKLTVICNLRLAQWQNTPLMIARSRV